MKGVSDLERAGSAPPARPVAAAPAGLRGVSGAAPAPGPPVRVRAVGLARVLPRGPGRRPEHDRDLPGELSVPLGLDKLAEQALVGGRRETERRPQDEEKDEDVRRDREEDGPLDRKYPVGLSLEVEEVPLGDFRRGGRALVQVEQRPLGWASGPLLFLLSWIEFKHSVFRPNWCPAPPKRARGLADFGKTRLFWARDPRRRDRVSGFRSQVSGDSHDLRSLRLET